MGVFNNTTVNIESVCTFEYYVDKTMLYSVFCN